MGAKQLSDLEAERFARDGYLIRRGLIEPDTVGTLVARIDASLNPALAPVEFEADVHYPGAPASRWAAGGQTPRRLLHAYGRDAMFRECAAHPAVVDTLQVLMDSNELMLSQNHHNCVMTKHPGFSSLTSWHQDIRYWRFDRPELVSTWLALGSENTQNGCLLVIPGSHKLSIEPGRFDAALFLRADLEENEALLGTAVAVELEAGDVLFFHSRTLHAAGQNNSSTVKRSIVFTYHTKDNEPIPQTRSAVFEDIAISALHDTTQ